MTEISIHEAKTHLSHLIRLTLTGKDLIIAKGNKHLIRLSPLSEALSKLCPGGAKDIVKYISDNFDKSIFGFDAI